MALLVQALGRAEGELAQLDDIGIPVPEGIEKRLAEHRLLKATMQAAPEEWKGRLQQIYREQREAERQTFPEREDDIDVPVDEHVLADIDALREPLRRQCALDDEIRASFRDAGVHGWFW